MPASANWDEFVESLTNVTVSRRALDPDDEISSVARRILSCLEDQRFDEARLEWALADNVWSREGRLNPIVPPPQTQP